jgi:pyruvate dehydrogenase E2 component (dihydrolipoamide acetyltransferase)
MAEEVFIPKFGQTVEEVTLVQWLVEDGQLVEQGQPVLDVETDKAIFTVEATEKGYIHIGPYKVGDIVPVVTVVAIIGKQEERFELQKLTSSEPVTITVEEKQTSDKQASPGIEQAAQRLTNDKVFASPRARKFAQEQDVNLAEVAASGEGGKRIIERDVALHLSHRAKVTPVAQKIAQAKGINLDQIKGSGPQGRITRADVESVAFQGLEDVDTMHFEEPINVTPAVTTPQIESEVLERIPLKGVRGIIARRMAESAHTTARVTLFMEVDATALITLRERLKKRFSEEWGFSPGYNDLLVKIVGTALRQFPNLNARLTEDAIEVLASIHVGVAVDTARGLIVPVLRDVDQKNLRQIGLELRNKVSSAQEGTILPDDLSGGTFTITNLGMYDITAFTPVINLPEAAILGIGKIAPAMRLLNGEVTEYQKLVLSLVFDHRLVDGAPAARFLQYIKELIEDPAMIITV